MPTTEPHATERLPCTLHGDYEGTVVEVAGARIHQQCPQCAEGYERAAEETEQQRKRDAVATNIERAAIPLRFSKKALADFEVQRSGQKKAHAVASRYVAHWSAVRENGTSMILCGEFGTGKTHIACAVLRAVIEENGVTGIYATALNAVRRIKETWRHHEHMSETEKQAIAAFVNPALLVLDEVGVQFGSDAEKLLLFDILNGRYEDVKPTIVISNLNVMGMEQFLGARVMDRLKEGGGYVLPFDWKSYREGGQC